MTTDIVERLAKEMLRFDILTADKALYTEASTTIMRLRTSLEEANARVAKLEARLEIDYVWGPSGRVEIPPESRDQHIDGIDARDETIKILERERDEARDTAIEDCAKVAEDFDLSEGYAALPATSIRFFIAKSIRALKGGGE